MTRSLAFQLYELIHSLTKGEKRHFKLYAGRNTQNKEIKFLQLFQLLDKMAVFDEKKVDTFLYEGVKNKSKLKGHLYEAIMTSLHLLNKDKLELRIRGLISRSQLLYHKGLYMQASAQLAKAKKIALENEQLLLCLEILKYEKMIEAKTIKSNHYQQAVDLVRASQGIQMELEEETFWSDLALRLYNHCLKAGHVRSREEFESFRMYFENSVSGRREGASTFDGELCRLQCYAWYNYIIQDFETYYKYSVKWMNHYGQNIEWRNEHYDSYLMGSYNCLGALFYLKDATKYEEIHNSLNDFVNKHGQVFLANTHINAFFYRTISYLNLYIVKGEYLEGYNTIRSIREELQSLEDKIDVYRKLALYYKMGAICFGASKFKEAISYFNIIDQLNSKYLRNDFRCYSRVLSLIAHFEIQNDYLIEYQVESTYRYLVKMKNLDPFHKEVLNFLKSSLSYHRSELLPLFKTLKERLISLSNDQFLGSPFLYTEIMAWLQSNIEKRSIEDIVREKLLN